MGALHGARLHALRRPQGNVTSLPSWRRWLSITHDPLRILFCGADDFSIYSLKALNEIKIQHPEKVASIDVVCKPDKRVGRGLKEIRQVPIKQVALNELKVPIHQIDTFTGWAPPNPFNLVVAVSFGLLVPPRILNSAKYGGLNVHPSLLPDFRGPAPLHHTLLEGLQKTGVTLQTLHPQHFDKGHIIDQTPYPGLDIPDSQNATVSSLLEFVGLLGAEMLKRNILTFNGDFLDTKVDALQGKARYAGKLTPEDAKVSRKWTPNDFEVRDRVLGRTWAFESPLGQRRVTFEGWENASRAYLDCHGLNKGKWWSVFPRDMRRANLSEDVSLAEAVAFTEDPWKGVYFEVAGNRAVAPKYITISGKPKMEVGQFRQYLLENGREERTDWPYDHESPTRRAR